MNSPERERPDLCPGALRLFPAADGGIGRLRFPGGAVPWEDWETIADLADGWGDGEVHLTSRGNIQIRGIRDAAGFASAVEEAGLLPHRTHERVRNIVISPLTGRVGGRADLRGLAGGLDDALCASPAVAGLSGRTLFALDDGRGDVAALAPDIGLRARSADSAELLLAGEETGRLLPLHGGGAHAIAVLVRAAEELAAIRGEHWRLAEVPGGITRVLTAVIGPDDPTPTGAPGPGPARMADAATEPGTAPSGVSAIPAISGLEGGGPPIGWVDLPSGAVCLGAGLRFAGMSAELARFIAAVRAPTSVTPWRTLVLHDLAEHSAEQVVRVLAPRGLVFDAGSPWLRLSACTGLPGCSRSHADVRSDAAGVFARGTVPSERLVHFSGCERRCGRPRGRVDDHVAAPGGGYTVISGR